MDTILKILGGIFIGRLLLNRVSTAVLSRIDIGRVTATNTSFSIVDNLLSLDLNVQLVNNTPLSIPVTSFKGVVIYGGIPISDIVYNTPTTVPGNSSQNFTLNVRSQLTSLIDNVSQIIANGSFFNSLSIQGNLLVNGTDIYPINKNIVTLG